MKTPADWERIRELFHHALALPPDERAAFLRARRVRTRTAVGKSSRCWRRMPMPRDF